MLHFPFKTIPIMREFCNISKSFKVSPMDPQSREQNTIYLLKIYLQPKVKGYYQLLS